MLAQTPVSINIKNLTDCNFLKTVRQITGTTFIELDCLSEEFTLHPPLSYEIENHSILSWNF